MTPSKPWKSSQFSRKIIRKFANYAIYIMTSWYPCETHGCLSNRFRFIFGSWNLDIHSLISLHMDFNCAKFTDFTIDIST